MPRPSSEDEIVAALLKAEAQLAEGKTLAQVAADLDVDEETFRHWQSEYADQVEEEKQLAQSMNSTTAEQEAVTQNALLLLAAVVAIILLASVVRGVFFAGEPILLAIFALMSIGVVVTAYYSLSRGEFPSSSRFRKHPIRRHRDPLLFWFYFWLYGVVVPLAVTTISLFVS